MNLHYFEIPIEKLLALDIKIINRTRLYIYYNNNLIWSVSYANELRLVVF